MLENNDRETDLLILIDSTSVRSSIIRPNDTLDLLITLPNGLILDKIDSTYYWDDMYFSESGLDYFNEEGRSIGKTDVDFQWPDGIVYYRFSGDVPPAERAIHATALNNISSVSSLRFRYRATNTGNYIVFARSTSGNSSPVGMQTGKQVIYIKNCNQITITHEVMHSLGFFHEQSRPDRENSIIIDSSNVRPEKWHNFQKHYNGTCYGPFDFLSIMLYNSMIGDTSFVYDTTIPTMTKLDGSLFYQGSTLSSYDIAGLNAIYGPPFHRLEHNRLQVIEMEFMDSWNSLSPKMQIAWYFTQTESVQLDSLLYIQEKSRSKERQQQTVGLT